jgi:hypothetical protein
MWHASSLLYQFSDWLTDGGRVAARQMGTDRAEQESDFVDDQQCGLAQEADAPSIERSCDLLATNSWK